MRKCLWLSLLFAGLFTSSATLAQPALSGIEFSPVRAATNLESESAKSYTGGLSFRGTDPRTEYNLPIALITNKDDGNRAELLKIDFQWRRFRDEGHQGPYGGLLVRAMRISDDSVDASDTRIGVGLVGGYRVFLTQNFYWGFNAQVGQYFDDFSDRYLDDGLDFSEFSADLADKLLFNIEFLKIGFRF